MLGGANNNLALEYISEMRKANMNFSFATYKRIGSGHDEASYQGTYPCASSIRADILSGKNHNFSNLEIYKMAHLERAFLYALRKMTADDFRKCPDLSEGLENRIVSCVPTAQSVEELFDSVKTKRYTHARIRRIMMSAFLSVTAEMQNQTPPYIKVLGFNSKGREILKKASETAQLPIVHKYADVKVLPIFAQQVYELESCCTDIFSLACDQIKPCGREKTENQIILI
ncbi:hypothetical protein SDC9_147747 [bioreactor metagenome]|uniref:Uncharacterized protein n=1 Tax=bioreactor metagenome TaxID=1076179 RepID=A0A645EF80_9ZZZZ